MKSTGIQSSALTVFLLLPIALPAQDGGTDTSAHMPGLEELAGDWNIMKPGGETECGHGTEDEFSWRPADPEELPVYLYGGGACWDAERCQEGSPFHSVEITSELHPSLLGGIMEPDHPEHPFADHTQVAFPFAPATWTWATGTLSTHWKTRTVSEPSSPFITGGNSAGALSF